MNLVKKVKRGFTLVELMIVVAIVGVLAALAIYGVSRYLRSSKTAEARNSVGQLGKDAASAFARETMSGSVLALGGSAAPANQLCPAVGDEVPADIAAIAGRKYQSSPLEWDTNGWPCLRFSMDLPQYYQYNYTVTGAVDAVDTTFQAIAVGDLDADGDTSTFSMNGQLAQDGTSPIAAILSPGINETAAEE